MAKKRLISRLTRIRSSPSPVPSIGNSELPSSSSVGKQHGTSGRKALSSSQDTFTASYLNSIGWSYMLSTSCTTVISYSSTRPPLPSREMLQGPPLTVPISSWHAPLLIHTIQAPAARTSRFMRILVDGQSITTNSCADSYRLSRWKEIAESGEGSKW